MPYIGEKPPRLSPLMQLGVVYFFVLHFFLCLEWWQAEHPACARALTAVEPAAATVAAATAAATAAASAVVASGAAAVLGVDANSSGGSISSR